MIILEIKDIFNIFAYGTTAGNYFLCHFFDVDILVVSSKTASDLGRCSELLFKQQCYPEFNYRGQQCKLKFGFE